MKKKSIFLSQRDSNISFDEFTMSFRSHAVSRSVNIKYPRKFLAVVSSQSRLLGGHVIVYIISVSLFEVSALDVKKNKNIVI